MNKIEEIEESVNNIIEYLVEYNVRATLEEAYHYEEVDLLRHLRDKRKLFISKKAATSKENPLHKVNNDVAVELEEKIRGLEAERERGQNDRI